ncbi:MAG: zinc metallopeptidase [Candidatus Dadabacteria bacterium]|nr:MAG: zinc metallopeptidase [Candidatus Dadabacteria bacterium]
MFYIDPLHVIMAFPCLLFSLWAQYKVKSAFKKASEIPASSGITGKEAAERVLQYGGVDGVSVELTEGFLGDHYDPKEKVLRLSPDVYNSRSLAALGVAAHEAGHALQDAKKYAPLVVRNLAVPVAAFGSNAAYLFIILGAVIGAMNLILVGITLFSAIVVFQVINLPVEFNASSRAKALLYKMGLITDSEKKIVASVLNAAALTYVAATVAAIVELLYLLIRFGIIGGNRD